MSVDLPSLREGAWSLDEFVDQANRLLPHLLPKDAGKRAAEPVNQRLVRHYATQGLLDEPLKEGREARYLYRHLLQLLVVRRLLAEGFTVAVVGQVMAERSDDELIGLVTGGVQIELVPKQAPSDERAEFLRRVRDRAGLVQPATTERDRLEVDSSALAAARTPTSSAASDGPNETGSPGLFGHQVGLPADRSPQGSFPAARTAAPQFAANPFHDSTWSHVTIMDGLELMVRDDFRLPDTRLGDAELAQLIKVTLLYLEQKQRGKP